MSMGFGADYDDLGYDTGLVSKEDIYDPAADLFDDEDDRDDFTPEALERYLKQLQEQKEQQKQEMKALKKELNLPHKLRMDIDDAKLIYQSVFFCCYRMVWRDIYRRVSRLAL